MASPLLIDDESWPGYVELLGDLVKKQYSQCLIWFLALFLSPFCSAQIIRIRVVNSSNGPPLSKQSVSVNLLYDKGQKAPAKYETFLSLETDAKGEAQFGLPEPAPAHIWIQVRLTSEHWHCGCMALATTQDVIQKGMSYSESTTSINIEAGRVMGADSMARGFGEGEDGVGGGGVVHEEGSAGRHMMLGVLV